MNALNNMESEDTEHSTTAMETCDDRIRHDLVSTAVKFLQNARVSTRPNSEKEAFLLKKGLTSAEIAAAFKEAGLNEIQEHYSSVKVAQVHGFTTSPAYMYTSRWSIIRDIGNAMMLLAGAAYGLHFLYKKIIRPWLFGPQQKKTSLEETVSQMNANLIEMIGDLTHAVQNLNETVGVMKQKQEAKSEIQELKSEVASLKALLLGRRQFPAPPSVGPPSIPAWQMTAGTLSASTSLVAASDQKVTDHSQELGRSVPHLAIMGEGNSLSSSPEIISVEDITAGAVLPNSMQMTSHETNEVAISSSAASQRDPSESSEGSAEMVSEMDLGGGVSGEDSGDTD